jgi:hypothetical protein
VGDIEMGVVFCFLGTVLPDVRTQHLAGSRVDDVGASVEGAEGISSLDVNLAVHGLASCCLCIKGLIEVV